MSDMQIDDESGDKDHFTIIPNYIANHSTANDQALYLQMKKHAGEKGECYASEKLLKDKLGIGGKALKKSIKYLIDHNWIVYRGEKEMQTNGGLQKRKVYSINNIWKMNSDFYAQGVSEREPLQGVSESHQGVSKRTQGVSESNQRGVLLSNKEDPTNKNQRRTKEYTQSYGNEFKNVQLSESEYTKLCDLLGEKVVLTLIDELDDYIESKGVKYKSHYATLRGWARRKIQEHHTKVISKGRGLA